MEGEGEGLANNGGRKEGRLEGKREGGREGDEGSMGLA